MTNKKYIAFTNIFQNSGESYQSTENYGGNRKTYA
jgi:hypothetical protein